VATVNILFSFSIAIYKAWAWRLPDLDTAKKLHVASQFSFLFIVLSIISIIPIFIDFIQRDNSDLSYKKSVGSCIVGLWTIIFSFVYIYISPKMNVKLTDPTSENGSSERGTDPYIVKYFVSHQPMISLVYWNFMQAPCIVLALLARNYYGIDLYMQFIVFGTIAITVIDIIHVRVNMIMGLTRLVNGDERKDKVMIPTRIDVFVYFTFVAMNLVISIPIFYKLKETNMTMNGFFALGVLFYAHVIQRGALLIIRFTRKHKQEDSTSILLGEIDPKSSQEEQQVLLEKNKELSTKRKGLQDEEDNKRTNYLYGDNNDVTFEANLAVQMVVSIAAFLLVALNPSVTA